MNDAPVMWRGIVGWENRYQVSNFGEVRSLDRPPRSRGRQARRGKYLKPAIRNGYPFVVLSSGGEHTNINIHRAVAEAFVDNPVGHPIVRHLDGKRDNNWYKNLAWGTYSDNFADMVKHGTGCRGERHPLSKLNARLVRRIRAEFDRGVSPTLIARTYQIDRKTVYQIGRKLCWRHVQ